MVIFEMIRIGLEDGDVYFRGTVEVDTTKDVVQQVLCGTLEDMLDENPNDSEFMSDFQSSFVELEVGGYKSIDEQDIYLILPQL